MYIFSGIISIHTTFRSILVMIAWLPPPSSISIRDFPDAW